MELKIGDPITIIGSMCGEGFIERYYIREFYSENYIQLVDQWPDHEWRTKSYYNRLPPFILVYMNEIKEQDGKYYMYKYID